MKIRKSDVYSICSNFNTGAGEVYVLYSYIDNNGDIKVAKKRAANLYSLSVHLRRVEVIDILNISPNLRDFDFKTVGVYQFMEAE